MDQKGKKWSRILRKILVLALLCGITLPMVPVSQAKPLEIKKGKLKLYEYVLVDTYEELTDDELFPIGRDAPILLAWENTTQEGNWGDGTFWIAKDSHTKEITEKDEGTEDDYQVFEPKYVTGRQHSIAEGFDDYKTFNYYAQSDWKLAGSESGAPISFYSQEDLGHMYLRRTGNYDKPNKSVIGEVEKPSPTFFMKIGEQQADKYAYDRWYLGSWFYLDGVRVDLGIWPTWVVGQLSYWPETDDDYGEFTAYDFTVQLFAEAGKENDDDYRHGQVNIFHNFNNGEDEFLKHKGNRLYMTEDGGTNNDWDRNFRIYRKIEHNMDAFVDDVTVVDGASLRIDDDVFVDDDCTITVEDGGVMVINSHLMNNGKLVVEEGGTLIINEGATVAPFANEGKQSGSVEIRGGNVIMMENSKLVAPERESYISISGGGSLVSSGIVITPNLKLSDSARYVIEDTGSLAMGYNMEYRKSSMALLTADEIMSEIDTQKIRYFDWLYVGTKTYSTLGSLSMTGYSQLINRGEIKVPYVMNPDLMRLNDYNRFMYMKVDGYRTENTICRNEGEGFVDGIFGFTRSQVIHLTPTWVKETTVFKPWPDKLPGIGIPTEEEVP